MKIQRLDVGKREATITLDADELVAVCNSLYRDVERKKKNNRLYADLMLVRDLSQYGHVDDWCMGKIMEQRELAKEDKMGEVNSDTTILKGVS